MVFTGAYFFNGCVTGSEDMHCITASMNGVCNIVNLGRYTRCIFIVETKRGNRMDFKMKTILFLLLTMNSYVYAVESSPYAGQQSRTIKALSMTDIDALRNGKGMGLAKAAELNHFPGPLHVLDEASKLSLTKSQLVQTKALYASMKEQAIIAGRQIITAEKTLDDMFIDGNLSEMELQQQLNKIGQYQAQLRFIHLKTHLKQKQILSSQQIKNYDRIRGYNGDGAHQHNHDGHH